VDVIKKLFNWKVVKSDNKKNNIVAAIVYKDIYNNENKGEISAIISLENYYRSMNRDIDSIVIIPMENGRILGTSIEFDEVYYFKDIDESVRQFILDNYKSTKSIWWFK